MEQKPFFMVESLDIHRFTYWWDVQKRLKMQKLL